MLGVDGFVEQGGVRASVPVVVLVGTGGSHWQAAGSV